MMIDCGRKSSHCYFDILLISAVIALSNSPSHKAIVSDLNIQRLGII